MEANGDNFIPNAKGGLSSQCRICHNYTRYLKSHDIEELNRRKEEKRKIPLKFKRK